jgi:hypothetical protein
MANAMVVLSPPEALVSTTNAPDVPIFESQTYRTDMSSVAGPIGEVKLRTGRCAMSTLGEPAARELSCWASNMA